MLRKLLRIGLVVVGFVVLAAAAGGGLFYAFQQHFYFAPPQADYPRPASALEAQRQDIDYFRAIVALDRSFSRAQRLEANRRIDALAVLPDALPQEKLHVALMQIVALADNGHTRMRAGVTGRKVMMAPLRLAPFADGFFVMRSAPAYADLLGGRVTAIDGVRFEQVLSAFETLRGGTDAFRRANAAAYMPDQELLYGLGIAQAQNRSAWTVVLPDGRTVTHMLTAEPEADQPQFTYGPRWRSAEPSKTTPRDWLSVRPAASAVPLSEQAMDTLFFRAAITGTCISYVRIEAIEDTDGQAIQSFLSDTESAFRAHMPCGLIVDLRGDGGGDYTNMWHFTHALPDLVSPHGRIVVLTDSGTFSAAITSTAFLKEAGGQRVTIMGEPVGDRMAFYSEGGSATLPNSKLSLSYETGKHDYGAPCRDWRDCFWLNWIYPVRVNSLAPDVPAPERFADWYEGHDIAFEKAVALLGGIPPMSGTAASLPSRP